MSFLWPSRGESAHKKLFCCGRWIVLLALWAPAVAAAAAVQCVHAHTTLFLNVGMLEKETLPRREARAGGGGVGMRLESPDRNEIPGCSLGASPCDGGIHAWIRYTVMYMDGYCHGACEKARVGKSAGFWYSPHACGWIQTTRREIWVLSRVFHARTNLLVWSIYFQLSLSLSDQTIRMIKAHIVVHHSFFSQLLCPAYTRCSRTTG